MVATVLMVAITVVMAALLYYVVSTLSHGGTSSPLGSAFTWGAPSNATGQTIFGCGATTFYCYHIDIAYAATGVRVTSLTLHLQSPAGLPVAWPTSLTNAGGTIELISVPSPAVVANYWPSNSTWQAIAPFTGGIVSGFSLAIYCGGAAEGAGQGLSGAQLVAIGTNGFSGTVSSSTFP